MTDTIFALASGAGKAGVAIYRISGPEASSVLTHLCAINLPDPKMMVRVNLGDSMSGEFVDDGMAVRFAKPASFTGEDVVELHLHGGWAITQAVMKLLGEQKNLRLAEPGEFTRRAFENGKMDLTAAEGLADLINAETDAQRLQAQRQMQGALGALYMNWRERLLKACALFEAEIDFSDEDLPDDLHDKVDGEISVLENEITSHLDDGNRGETIRDGFYIAIIGPPNAGKSSLLNYLSQKDAAIVSEMAGTTRDVIEVHLDIKGFPVILADTAGLRETEDAIEFQGVKRARERADHADLVLAVHDGALGPDRDPIMDDFADLKTIHLLNKVDLVNVDVMEKARDQDFINVSAKTGDGIDQFLAILEKEISDRCYLSASPTLTRQRHRIALQECVGSLERYQEAGEAELKAEDLRLAARSLGRITGQVGVEDILDVIFAEFCIGK